jgi:glycosyltransferase involved in cell wall biosynthesis
MKRKVLIATINDYIVYQPTILNLYDFLSPYFDVTIISFQPKFVTKQKDLTRNIKYLRTNEMMDYLIGKADFMFSKLAKFVKLIFPKYTYQYYYYNTYLPFVLKRELRKQKDSADIVIAVDMHVLYIAQQIFGPVHFLSLEIENNTNKLYKLVDPSKVKSVFVQSQERYDYMFPGVQLKTFIVPNGPVFRPGEITKRGRKDFIWAGAILRHFAVMEILNFFEKYPQYKLILKGGGDQKTRRLIDERYGELLRTERIVIDRTYLPEESFIDFIAGFRIGFCFYTWDLIQASFNYYSAPSGKLLMYMAAGTPVVASNIPAFKFIEEAGAGVLVSDYEPATIFNAVQKIESDYENYSAACLRVAAACSFDKNVAPYIEFLKAQK